MPTVSSKKRKESKGKIVKNLIIVVVIFVLICAGWYAIRQYQTSNIDAEGLVVCSPRASLAESRRGEAGNQTKCEKSLHIHAKIDVSVCGEKINFPKLTGNTNEQHTHDEKNLMHFHNRLEVNPQTQAVTDQSPLYLANFFKNMNVRFTDACLGDKCNGDTCPDDAKGRVTMTVNGQPNNELNHYPWNDGDNISIVFQ